MMIRYDQKDTTPVDEVSEEKREIVQVDAKHQEKIKKLFFDELQGLGINGVKLINSVNNKMIMMNPIITLDDLSKQLGKKLHSKEEFIKEYYMHRLDNYTDLAYDKKVTAIQEFPYSFQAGTNENLIAYTFIS